MEDFSYQPFLLDPAHHLPLSPLQVEETINGASCFLYYHTLNSVRETSTTESKTHESSSSLDVSRVSAEMRGNRDGSCSTSVQPKNSKEAKSRKQRKPSGGGGGGDDVKQAELKKLRADEKEKDACEEPPLGYIHVRARRGQATDSHSLSERARREKIGERMKLLQTLVPGCDKVIGKALMLDEIINYVQSLQNQVEFLSMKLAAMNPVLYNFGVDFDGHLNQLEKLGSINQTSLFHLNALEHTSRNYPIMMGTPPPFLLHTQGPITFSQNTASLMQMGDQRPGFLN